MAVDDFGYNLFNYIYNLNDSDDPVRIEKVTENSISAYVRVCTLGQSPSSSATNYLSNVTVGIMANNDIANSYVGGYQGVTCPSTMFIGKEDAYYTYFPHDYPASAEFVHDYLVELNNTNLKIPVDEVPSYYPYETELKSNLRYFVTGYVFYEGQDFKDYCTLPTGYNSWASIYQDFESNYHYWSRQTGSYFWPNSSSGIPVYTPPSKYYTLDVNNDDIASLENLRYGQTQLVRYSFTQQSYDGDGQPTRHVLSDKEIKHYVRYKYSSDAIFTSWQQAYLDKDGNWVFSIIRKSDPILTIEFSRGDVGQQYAQDYYEDGLFVSAPFEKTFTLASEEDDGALKKLETPEYRIEIWKSRLSDEADYQFVEDVENKMLSTPNTGYINLNRNYGGMAAKFEIEFSISAEMGSATGMQEGYALFGIKPNYGPGPGSQPNGCYSVIFKRISSSRKAVACYGSTESTSEWTPITWHEFDAEDDEIIKVTADSFNPDGSGGGIFINDELMITKTEMNLWGSLFNDEPRVSLFNMSHTEVNVATGDVTNVGWTSGRAFIGKIYSVKVYDSYSDDLLGDYVPAIKRTDNILGVFDTLHKTFYPCECNEATSENQFNAGFNKLGTEYGMIADISNICINNLNIVKERNLPDTLKVDVEYVQFKKKLDLENTKISDVIKPYLVDVVVKRNFETIFTGTLMYAKVTLQAVGKQSLTIEAVGYGEHLSKRYINCSYGNMNYPQMAKQILYDAQHEMNWIDNYDFLSNIQDTGSEDDTSYFNGWGAIDSNYESYIPVKTPDTNAYKAHWQNGSIPFDPGCMLQCFKLTCTKLGNNEGSQFGGSDASQFLRVEFWHCTNDDTERLIDIHMTIETGDEFGSASICNKYFSFVTPPSCQACGPNWRKFSTVINLGRLNGFVKHVSFTNESEYQFLINDFNIYRPTDVEYLSDTEQNISATIGYNLHLDTGYFDELFNNDEYFAKDRIRHYHMVNAKDAMYNLTKLKDQNFEYIVDNEGKFIFKVAEGDLVVSNVATYPGQISEISIERDANTVYNVGYAVNTHIYDNSSLQTDGGQSFAWADLTNGTAIDEESVNKYKARVQVIQVDTTTRREIESEAQGAIHASDEVQNIPTLKFDSNIYNPGNVHIGDAFGVNINIDELFDFINGEYRVYGYNLSVSKDHVERMDITLMIPSALQLQLMTFPITMKNMLNNIKRLQVQTSK